MQSSVKWRKRFFFTLKSLAILILTESINIFEYFTLYLMSHYSKQDRMFLVSYIVFLQQSCHEMSVIFDYLEYKLPMNLIMRESIIEITEQVDLNTVYFFCLARW